MPTRQPAPTLSDEPLWILGAGGAARSAAALLRRNGLGNHLQGFVEEERVWSPRQEVGLPVVALPTIDLDRSRLLVAIGASRHRAEVVSRLPGGARFATCIDTDALFLDDRTVGEGSIIYPTTYLSRNSRIGAFALLMPGTGIGHDVTAGAFLTAALRVSIGGGVRLGDRVFIGMNACLRDGIRIADDVTIGMGSVVTRDIEASGSYGGNPARRLAGPA